MQTTSSDADATEWNLDCVLIGSAGCLWTPLFNAEPAGTQTPARGLPL